MAKAKPMNRTSGVARRKSKSTMSESERIGRQRANEVGAAPVRDKRNTNIDLGQTAYDWLGVGADKGKFSFDPVNAALTFVPFGKVATALKIGAKATKIAGAASKIARVAPKSVRVAGAAKRVVEGAARRGRAAETAIELGKGLKQTGGYAKSSASAAARVAPNTYAAGRFRNAGTVFDGGQYTAPTRYVSNQDLRAAGKKTAYDLSQLGEARVKKGGQMIYDATKTLAKTTNRVEGGTREAAAEIRRRLAALKSGRTAK